MRAKKVQVTTTNKRSEGSGKSSKSVFRERSKITDTITGETTEMDSKSVSRGGKEKRGRVKFRVKDKEGKVIAKETKRFRKARGYAG